MKIEQQLAKIKKQLHLIEIDPGSFLMGDPLFSFFYTQKERIV